jgi:hypothetical protein
MDVKVNEVCGIAKIAIRRYVYSPSYFPVLYENAVVVLLPVVGVACQQD